MNPTVYCLIWGSLFSLLFVILVTLIEFEKMFELEKTDSNVWEETFFSMFVKVLYF